MNKNVLISLKGNQNNIDHGEDSIELVTEGKFYKKGQDFYITYKESEITGMEGTTTTLKASGDMLTLMRFGTLNSHMIFQKGKRHITHYNTQYGVFTLGVDTIDINIQLNDNGGEIQVDYSLDIDNNNTGNNRFHMIIREIEDESGKKNEKHN